MSSRSEALMSQWRCSLISVGSHGLTSAPRASMQQVEMPPMALCSSQSVKEKMSPLPMIGIVGGVAPS